MTASEDEAKYDEARFLALISGLAAGVMQHLGKIVNPLSGKIEKELEAAKGSIDILRMLREKTKGNLTEREERNLDAFISSAQLNYLDEVKAEAEKPKEKPEEKTAENPEEKPEEKPEQEPEQEKKEQPAKEEKEDEPAKQEDPAEEKSEQTPAEGDQPSE